MTSGTLTLVATPIGNLGDFPPRAAEVLAAADIIACEDTRVTRKLMSLTGTTSEARLTAYHDHNGATVRPWLLEQLAAGRNVALVSDAGTPLISDPGYKLVAACRAQEIPVLAVPGPSAVLAALAVSGLPTDRFFFAGFLTGSKSARRAQITELAGLRATLVWFETPSRIAVSLAEMADILGPRQAAVTRELTKLHEEVRCGRLDTLAAEMAANRPKGEIVLVVGGRPDTDEGVDDTTLDAMLRAELDGQRLRDAVRAVVEATGLPRNRVYRAALALDATDDRKWEGAE